MVKEVGLSAEYCEQITPIERHMLWNYHIEFEHQKQRHEKQSEGQYDALSDNLPLMSHGRF